MEPNAGRRIALLGGSFDPPHAGHLAIARAARASLALDEVLLAPAGLQPWKQGAEASFEDRLAMTELLCVEGLGTIAASAIDAPQADGTPNYSVAMLERARAWWPGVQLFAIVGADSFADLPRWHEAERMMRLAEWIVVSRPRFDRRIDAAGDSRVHWIGGVAVPVASRELRARLRLGDACAEALPTNVVHYIRGHGLYGTGEGERGGVGA